VYRSGGDCDVNGTGDLSGLDAVLVAREVVGLDPPEIPPLPGGRPAPQAALVGGAQFQTWRGSIAADESGADQPIATGTTAGDQRSRQTRAMMHRGGCRDGRAPRDRCHGHYPSAIGGCGQGRAVAFGRRDSEDGAVHVAVKRSRSTCLAGCGPSPERRDVLTFGLASPPRPRCVTLGCRRVVAHRRPVERVAGLTAVRPIGSAHSA